MPGAPLSVPPAASAAAWNASTVSVLSAPNATWHVLAGPSAAASQKSGRVGAHADDAGRGLHQHAVAERLERALVEARGWRPGRRRTA